MDKATFIAAIAPLAVREQIRTGVLASVTIAQAALESGWGASAPGNNLFGIKGTGQELASREYVNGHYVDVVGGYRVYDDWEGSIIDHSRYLLENSRYAAAGFFALCAVLDYRGAALALQSAGYATDPAYASKLIGIIETNGLASYDRLAAAASGNGEDETIQLEQWQWKMLGDALNSLHHAGLLNDSGWADKAYRSELTQTELAWLNTVMLAREQGVEV